MRISEHRMSKCLGHKLRPLAFPLGSSDRKSQSHLKAKRRDGLSAFQTLCNGHVIQASGRRSVESRVQ
jgi:hypothetical protein